MHSILSEVARVGSTFNIPFSFTDEAETDLVPNVLTWKLTDSDGTVLNSRTGVSLTPAATVNVTLSDNDLVLTSVTDDGIRFVTLTGTYDSAVGLNLPLTHVVEFVLMASDPTLAAESSFIVYVTAIEMETYFFQRLNVGAYDNASRTDRLKAATMATKSIDRLNFHGNKADSSQTLEFPRGGDSSVPQDIKDACCEILLALLNGVVPDFEYDSTALISETFLKAKTQRDTSFNMEHISVGIPSRTAWQLLKPYVQVPQPLNLFRTS